MKEYLSEGIARVYLLGAGFSIAASANVPLEQRLPGMRDLSEAVVDRLRTAYPFPSGDFAVQGDIAEAYNALQDFSFEQRYPA